MQNGYIYNVYVYIRVCAACVRTYILKFIMYVSILT